MPSRSAAPGLKARTNADGSITFYWIAAGCSRKAASYPIRTVRLVDQSAAGGEARAAQCRKLKAELDSWLDDNDPNRVLGFDGTVAGLLRLYEIHPESPFHDVKYNTRAVYLNQISLMRATVGRVRLSMLTGVDFKRWYRQFSEPDEPGGERKINRGWKLMNLMRTALSWGVVLELPHCQRLREILAAMRFEAPKARTTFLTVDQVEAVIAQAHAQGAHSIALAQALQFELTLRQKDVIGEWVPHAGPGSAENVLVKDGRRWANGLLWSHIQSDGVLRKVTTKTGAEAAFVIDRYPLVVRELGLWTGPRVGPIIVNEETGHPYHGSHFSQKWRRIATKAGVPKHVFNMDSRSGGITEATDAGAPIEMVRHHATHSDGRTTQRYSRQTLGKTAEVAELRVKHRNKPKT